MKNYVIKKNVNEAVLTAKISAIREFEESEQITVIDSLILNSEVWYIDDSKSCQCVCGESSAFEISLHPKYLKDCDLLGATPDGFPNEEITLSDLSEGHAEDVYYGFCGYCEVCGE